MLKKWTDIRGEGVIAEAFSTAWRGESCTRAAVNRLAVVPGGLPCDNNGEEGKNSSQKRWMEWQKYKLVGYFSVLADFIEAESRSDKEFGGKMNREVNCSKFYADVMQLYKRPISSLTVSFDYDASVRDSTSARERSASSSASMLPSGTLIITSNRIIATLQKEYRCKSLAEFTTAVSGASSTRAGPRASGSSRSTTTWLKQFIDLSLNPINFLRSESMDFDTAIDWMTSFYLFTPIQAGEYLDHLHARLASTGMNVMSLEDIQGLESAGLMSCSCKTWLHYAWCRHSAADAFRKGILKSFPRNMDPNLPRKRKIGRPISAKPGGARTLEEEQKQVKKSKKNVIDV